MMTNYKNFFGFQKEPFSQDMKVTDLYPIPGFNGTIDRFMFAIDTGAVSVITGDIGTGKSSSLRFGFSKLHPSQYKVISIVANSGTVMELIRQMAIALDADCKTTSIASAVETVRNIITDIIERKQKPVLIIDESHIMRLEVFAQLHILFQFDFDSKPVLPIILCGYNSLIDKLMYHTSRPLSSRVVGRSHLQPLTFKDMKNYIKHHLEVVSFTDHLFSDEAIVAIQRMFQKPVIDNHWILNNFLSICKNS